MNLFDANSEAEWMAETIVEDFALSLELADRVRFYSRLIEVLTERRNQLQQVLEDSDSDSDLEPIQ